MYIAEETIEKIIKEDVPYIDLTSLLLNINNQKGIIKFVSREQGVVSSTEEVERILNKFNIKVLKYIPSGNLVKPNDIILQAEGNADTLHIVWKMSMNILEYCSGISTRTRKLVNKAKAINPNLEIVTTRKMFPGTKELSIKAAISGGALPHRLGLSETILIFNQHLNFIGGIDGLISNIQNIKRRACEKKIIVEVNSLEDAVKLTEAGVDGLQFDKFSSVDLKKISTAVKAINPRITLIGTGGINENTIEEYSHIGIDAISTSSVYFGKPLDISVTIDKSIQF